MDDDIFSDLSVINAKKTYLKKGKKVPLPKNLPDTKRNLDDVEKTEPLTTKAAIKFLLEGKLKSKVCRYCLNITPALSELDQIMKIGSSENLYKVTIRDIVASFHPFKVGEDPNFPDKICQKCLDRALGAYLFTQQCDRAERAMLNCFDDMYDKFQKLDPIDRPKKRGRQKLNPNHNILHAEHAKVIDYAEPIIHLINAGAETHLNEPDLNNLECKKCWQVLPNLESLINHEKIHPKTMWYHCRLCGKSFAKCNQLKKHHHRVHVLGKEAQSQLDKDFKCQECDHVTDDCIQHLQHMEKHKFKNIMEHLIERRMDSLCAICFSSGRKMMDLDKMVCIHGGHPDLMGDKTLYTLLASTLPNQQSYKYQELCVPSKAQKMTITKRHSQDTNTKRLSITNINRHSYSESTKENYVFSYPDVVSRDKFKTEHFYFYVFTDPEYIEDSTIATSDAHETVDMIPQKTKIVEVIEIEDDSSIDAEVHTVVTRKGKMWPTTIRKGKKSRNDREIGELNAPSTKIVEVIEIDNIEDDSRIDDEVITVVTGKGKMGPSTIRKGKQSKNNYSNSDSADSSDLESVTKTSSLFSFIKSDHMNTEITSNLFKFSKPYLVDKKQEEKDDTIDLNVKSQLSGYKFQIPEFKVSVPEYIDTTDNNELPTKGIENEHTLPNDGNIENNKDGLEQDKTATKSDDKRLTEELCDKCWIFKNTQDVCKLKTHDGAPRNVIPSTITRETPECQFCWIFKHMGTCDYCQKPIEKVDFTCEKSDKKYKRDEQYFKDKKIWQCNICLTNNNSNRMSCHCCGTVKFSQCSDTRITFGTNRTLFQVKERVVNEIPRTVVKENVTGNIDPANDERNKISNFDEPMDYGTQPEENIEPTIVNINMQTMDIEPNVNDFEQMDVEENPILLNRDWNQLPLFNVNIGANAVDMVPGRIEPNVGANLQFNIGSPGHKQAPRKLKRALRPTPKAFHK